MKKVIVISSILAAVAFSSSAFAQAKNFEGFTAGINVSSVGGSAKVNGTDESGGSQSETSGQQSFVPGIELGYNFAASDSVILGFTATYDFTKTKFFDASDVDSFDSGYGQNRYSINFKPGYVIAPNVMLYATVGYNSMTLKSSGTGEPDISKRLNGIGYGAGISVMLSKNIFAKAEVQQVGYNSLTSGDDTVKPSTTIGTIGIGYKF